MKCFGHSRCLGTGITADADAVAGTVSCHVFADSTYCLILCSTDTISSHCNHSKDVAQNVVQHMFGAADILQVKPKYKRMSQAWPCMPHSEHVCALIL